MTAETIRIACIDCGTTNRVPAQRLGDHPTCGRCKSALFRGEPADVGPAEFETMLRHTDIPVLVDFWAPWCGPCRMMAPVIAQAAQRLEPQMRVVKLDTERAPALAARLDIRSIPTLALFLRGNEIARQSGAMDLGSLIRWVQTHCLRAA